MGKSGAVKEIVNSAKSLALIIAAITRLFKEHSYLVVSVRFGRDRSLEQNALWAGMYKRLVQFGLFESVDDAKSYCKLHFGVTILLRDCEKFRDGWYRNFFNADYEYKLHLMSRDSFLGPDGFPVTRILGRKQGVEYTDRIADHPYFVEKHVNFEDLLSDK